MITHERRAQRPQRSSHATQSLLLPSVCRCIQTVLRPVYPRRLVHSVSSRIVSRETGHALPSVAEASGQPPTDTNCCGTAATHATGEAAHGRSISTGLNATQRPAEGLRTRSTRSTKRVRSGSAFQLYFERTVCFVFVVELAV